MLDSGRKRGAAGASPQCVGAGMEEDQIAQVAFFQYEFVAVDAAVASMLDSLVWTYTDGQNTRITSERMAISAGSSRYRASLPTVRDAFEVVVRAMPTPATDERVTSVIIYGHKLDPAARLHNLRAMLASVAGIIDQDCETMRQLGVQKPIPHTPANPPSTRLEGSEPRNRPQGAPRKEENNRARARLAAGEDEDLVYRDWLRDRGQNPELTSVRQRWKDAWRKLKARQKDGRT